MQHLVVEYLAVFDRTLQCFLGGNHRPGSKKFFSRRCPCSVRIDSGGETNDYGPGEPWFESGPEPVLATASTTEESAFVRVMLLPREWAGKRTIMYIDPADVDRPKLQRPTVYGEYPIAF